SGDGEGWGCDRGRVAPVFVQRDVAVANAGRGSPSETHTLGSVCDCRFTKRELVSDQGKICSSLLSRMNSPLSVFTVRTACPSPLVSRTTVINRACLGQPARISMRRLSRT